MARENLYKTLSLSVDTDTYDRIKSTAAKRNLSISALIREVAEKNFSATDEDVDTVIFKIPNSAKVNEEDLRKWLILRVEAVIRALINGKK